MPHEGGRPERYPRASSCCLPSCGCPLSNRSGPRWLPSRKEGWPAARFLAALAEHELAERTLRRIKAISPKPGCRRLSPGVAAAIGIEIGGAIVRVRAGIELGLLGKVLRLLKAMK